MKKIIIELVNIIIRVFISLVILVTGFTILGCFENLPHQEIWGGFVVTVAIFIATLMPNVIKLKKQ